MQIGVSYLSARQKMLDVHIGLQKAVVTDHMAELADMTKGINSIAISHARHAFALQVDFSGKPGV